MIRHTNQTINTCSPQLSYKVLKNIIILFCAKTSLPLIKYSQNLISCSWYSISSQQKSPSLLSPWSIAIFFTWTVTSFLCHFFAKHFLGAMGESMSTGRARGFSSAQLKSGAINATLLSIFQVGKSSNKK